MSKEMYAICPKCEVEINYLLYTAYILESGSVALTDYGVVGSEDYYLTKDVGSEDEVIGEELAKGNAPQNYHCPECNEVLTYEEDEAVKILTPKKGLLSMVLEAKKIKGGRK